MACLQSVGCQPPSDDVEVFSDFQSKLKDYYIAFRSVWSLDFTFVTFATVPATELCDDIMDIDDILFDRTFMIQELHIDGYNGFTH